MKHQYVLYTVVCYAALALSGVVLAEDAKVVANGQAAQARPDTPELRRQIRESLAAMDRSKQTVLLNAFARDYVRHNPISGEAVMKEYERAKSEAGDKEYRVHHILVKTEPEAKEIIAQLKGGGNFDKIAAERSQDMRKTNGGDLGWLGPERYVPPLAAAIKKLKKGEITDAPVQTQFGWHVIRVGDERARKFPEVERVKQRIGSQLQRQAVASAVSDLRAKASVE